MRARHGARVAFDNLEKTTKQLSGFVRLITNHSGNASDKTTVSDIVFLFISRRRNAKGNFS